MTRKCLLAAVAVLAACAASSQPARAADVELGTKYVDDLRGFSVKPPAGLERRREFSANQLVTWVARDEKTAAIAYTLTISQVREAKEKIDLKEYAKALAAKMERDDKYTIQSTDITEISGKPAIVYKGVTSVPMQHWERQSWILVKDGVFMVVRIWGPVDMKARLEAIYDAVIATLQVSDPEAALAKRETLLKAGTALLEGLTDAKLAAAIQKDQQYFVFKIKDKPVGFMVQAEAPATMKNAASKADARGYEITTWIMTELPKDQLRLMKRRAFVTGDRTVERWREQLQVGDGAKTAAIAEDGFRQGDAIVCSIDRGNKIDTLKKTVPPGFYLSRALGMLLPRLVDLTKNGAYAFASYTSDANGFDMRTLIVEGPDKLPRDGKDTECVRLTDQAAADVEPTTVWVNEKGLVLRMRTADGTTLDSVTKDELVRAYPKMEALISAMSGWAVQP